MRAAEKFFAEVIAEHGIEEGDIVRIPMTQCELARRRQIAASTVGSYLSAMGPRVVQRTPQILLTVPVAPTPVDRDDDLIEAFRVLTVAQARVIELLTSPANAARGPRAAVRGSREFFRDEVQEEKEVDLLPFLETRVVAREPRADPADWSDADLDTALAPLHRAADLAGAKAMNNRPQLLAALRPFALAEIEAAVAELVTAVNSRTSTVRSPFGMLVARARSGSMPTVQPPRADEPPTFESSSSESVIPNGVRRAVEALSADALMALDSFVDGEIGSCTYRAPAMTNALRLEYFEPWDNARTRAGHPGDNSRTFPAQHRVSSTTTGTHS